MIATATRVGYGPMPSLGKESPSVGSDGGQGCGRRSILSTSSSSDNAAGKATAISRRRRQTPRRSLLSPLAWVAMHGTIGVASHRAANVFRGREADVRMGQLQFESINTGF